MQKLIIILAISISIILTGCWAVPDPPVPPEPNGVAYRAFFVGVGDYLFFSSGVDLTSPKPNTEKLENLFGQCKFGEDEIEFTVIETLVDRSATKENILNGIVSAFAESDDNDVSYFYYMGHGGVREGIPVITGSDTKFTLETSITVHELEECLSMIPGTKVIFFESCHVGNFINKGQGNFNDMVIDIFSQNSLDLFNKESYQVLTCGKGCQTCWTSSYWSYFCEGLLDGLEDLNADTNEDKIVDMSETHKHIIKWVNDNCSKDQDAQIYPDNSTFPIIEY